MKTDGKLENPRKLYVAQISPILYYKFPRNNPTKIPFLSRNKSRPIIIRNAVYHETRKS